jgi:heat-inducible transcriptional repressor
MKANLKSIALKKPAKDQRERQVLLGLVDLYLQTGKPIGSNTLKESGFNNLSSATIRNYFSKLEESGYLKQQHSSGGRIPTHLAYKLYAESYLESAGIDEKMYKHLSRYLFQETREIAGYLQQAAETLSEHSGCAVFLSSPRFDQDFVLDIKLVGIDHSRCLCILITDFGLVRTEIFFTDKKLSNFSLKRIEAYFRWRMTGIDKPVLSDVEEMTASRFYNELMLRHIVGYANFTSEDIYKTGFSKLLNYPDFNDATALAHGLSLFENHSSLRSLIHECCKKEQLSCWIGDDLYSLTSSVPSCSVIAIPYQINQVVVGAFALLGPNRIPYRTLFSLLKTTSNMISENLTKSLFKFKITFRQPKPYAVDFKHDPAHFLDQTRCLLLEDKSS